MSKPKILFYDIETTPLLAYIWRPGEQVVRHGQLVKGRNVTRIICVTYCWNDGKPAKAIGWGYREQDDGKVVALFDTLIKQADVVIGKNSDRFDNKHINTIRFLEGGHAMPDWLKRTDDLEKQIRKYFNFPSNSLDYISDLLGLGGKIKMEFDDWINIVEKVKGKGLQAYKKMLNYGIKDIEDTRALWNKMEAHIEPKYNAATVKYLLQCRVCGSGNIVKNGSRAKGTKKYQRFECKDHHGYAGQSLITIKKDGTTKLGDIK